MMSHFRAIFARTETANGEGEEYFINGIRNVLKVETPRLNGDINAAELKQVLAKAKKLKSPGRDGIPYEFYQRFFNLVGETMVQMMNWKGEIRSTDYGGRWSLARPREPRGRRR